MPKTSVTSLATNDMLQWNGTNWVNTAVLAGVRASSVMAGGINGQAMTSNGPNTNPAFQGMTTQGDVEYHNGTNRTRLAPGTSGQFLKTQGASANPVWVSLKPGSSGALTNSPTNTASETDVATISLSGNTLGTSGIAKIRLFVNNISSTGGDLLSIRGYYASASVALVDMTMGTAALGGFIELILIANAATDSQRLSLSVILHNKIGTTGTGQQLTNFTTVSAAIDSTSAQTFKITGQWSGADTGDSFQISGYEVLTY